MLASYRLPQREHGAGHSRGNQRKQIPPADSGMPEGNQIEHTDGFKVKLRIRYTVSEAEPGLQPWSSGFDDKWHSEFLLNLAQDREWLCKK